MPSNTASTHVRSPRISAPSKRTTPFAFALSRNTQPLTRTPSAHSALPTSPSSSTSPSNSAPLHSRLPPISAPSRRISPLAFASSKTTLPEQTMRAASKPGNCAPLKNSEAQRAPSNIGRASKRQYGRPKSPQREAPLRSSSPSIHAPRTFNPRSGVFASTPPPSASQRISSARMRRLSSPASGKSVPITMNPASSISTSGYPRSPRINRTSAGSSFPKSSAGCSPKSSSCIAQPSSNNPVCGSGALGGVRPRCSHALRASIRPRGVR
jgi:hypothetical protein